MSVTAVPATRRRGNYPAIPAIVFTIWATVVPFGFGRRILNADGDLLRHIRHGEWMLAHGTVVRADHFSYTMAGEPYVGFEYLSQIVLALAHRAGGLAAVAILAGLIIGATYATLTRFLLARGTDPLLTYLIGIVAAVLGAIHWNARPHLFTLLGITILLHVLEPGARRLPVWWIFPFFVLWTNLHAGFLIGLVFLGIYLAGSAAEWLAGGDRPRWAEAVRYYAAALGLAALATFLNPYGVGLHRYIIRFFSQPFLRDYTHEFMSPNFHDAGGKMLLAALIGIIALLALVPGRPTFPRLFLLLANIAFALEARRNVPLLAATVFPVLALHFDPAWRRVPDWRGIRAVFERDARRASNAPTIVPVAVMLVTLALFEGRLGRFQLVPDGLDPKEFPIAAVEWARTDDVTGRIFNDFVWGGYLQYAWPEQRIFIDGNTDFYGTDLMRTYINVSGVQPGWRDTLARREISFVLMPSRSAMVHELMQDGDWRLRYCDRTATLLERKTPAQREADVARFRRCAE